jgi:aminoglycoside phosphotransferase (APT) family kinase protein
MREGLARWILANEPGARAVHVDELQRIDSVGNAREPWSFRAVIEQAQATEMVRCVMLVKAAAGQLETTLPPEFAAIGAVHGTGVPVARPLWIDADGHAFGRPFFVTELVDGVADMHVLRAPAGDRDARATIEHLADVAADLHVIELTPERLASFAPTHATTAASDQLDHWEPIAERQRLEPLPALRYAFSWLRANAPAASRVSIVHGDLRVGNFLAAQGRITALLDWEMVHLGDPVEDLAWTYRSLWSPERQLPFAEFLARYTRRCGIAVDPAHLRYYRMFNEIKHSVISLTAARAFDEGRTSNLRFADRNTTLAPFLGRFFDWRHEADPRERQS